MLRSQKDVDKHVQEAFRNITNEKERNLRCYNVAKLYHKVGDFQSTKQYVELYLKEQPKAAGAHKLLGQALEALKDYPKALQEYKCSLSLESRQPDLVLKVCELLVETKTRLNTGEAKYWMERAEEVSGNHQAVFRLKEYLIKMEDGSGDQAQLAHLIEKEIEARPQDHVPRIRLLNLYLDSRRVLDAYKYVIDLESRCLFRDNLQWYSYVVEVLKAYQREVKNLDAEFYVNNLCVLERYAALCAREQLKGYSSVYTLDQACFEAAKYCQKGGEQLLQECVRHMGGQLCFHLGTALLREGKQSRSGWKEWTPFAWALMTLAYTIPGTVDFASHCSTTNGREKHRKLTKLWKEDCAFRCSQAGHIVLSLTLERKRFVQINGGNWRERIYKLLFPSQVKSKPESEKDSYFMTNGQFADVQEISPSLRDIALHDDVSQHQRPDSLHALVWLGLQYVEPATKQVTSIGNPYVLPHRLSPNFACHVFDELKLSTGDLEKGGIETLSRLDVDTFLCASVFCAAASQDERCASLVLGEAGRPSVLPVDLMESLCTEAQNKWWSCAYRLHSNKSRSDIGEVRMTVVRGLEVVRLLGSHGMDVRLIVLLAKLFTEKASSMSTPKDNIPAVTKRAQLFWQRAIYLLERMEKNQPLRMPENPLFSYGGKELTSSDVRLLLEEGRFFMACRLMKEEKYEEAIEAFQGLKNPYASFYEGLMYKKLADAERESLGGDKLTTDMKSNYVILLQKSRSALHLTLDRLRSPQNAGNHPLNVELEQHIEEVENCLAREESDIVFSGASRNAHEGLLDDSFTSNRFEDSLQCASRIVNTSMHHTLLSTLGYANGQSPTQGLTSTPFKSRRNIESSMNVDASSRRVEARPSPERLDAQLKRMSITTDTVMQIVVDQNRQMLDSNKTMMEALEKTRVAVEELQKQMADLKVEVGKLKHNDARPQPSRNVDYMVHPEEDYEYDVAASQLRSLQAYPSAASYGSFPAQAYNYDNRSASSVPLQSMLPQALYPQAQVPMARNVDPNLLLASYYPQTALGLTYDRPGTTGVALPGTMPGVLPGSAPSSIPVPNNVMPAVAADNSSDSFRKSTSLMGTPIISHANVAAPAMDLSSSGSVPSVSQSQFHSAHESAAQRFSISSVQQVLSGKTSLQSGISGDTLPHNFQISMPPQATIPTTESLEKSLSPLKPIAIEAILPNVPMPAYSAVSSRQPDVKPSRLSTGSAGGNETFTEDADYNPCADFKPIIPLPDEVTVTTGEEDETPLFVRRAKLFRFVEREWKERGVGDMKILKHNVTGKLRILMRREQIHKICANHFILPEMELAPQTGSDRAWSWGANDFSDGEAHIEKLCVRFKTKEDAQDFKEAFDQARKLAKDATPVKQPAPTVSTAKSDVKASVSQASASPGKVELGGFSFIQPPVLKPVERQAKTTPGKDKESVNTVSKPSPFAGFSFTPPSSSIFGSSVQSSVLSTVAQTTTVSTTTVFGPVAASPSGSTLFGSKTSSVTTVSSSSSGPVFSSSGNLPDFAALAAQSKDKDVGKKDTNFKGFEGAGSKVFGGAVSSSSDVSKKSSAEAESGETEEFEPTAVFNPVVPLPSLVEVRTGEEGEDVLFEDRAKLLRFDSKEWKERGIGKMKVLKNRETGKVRLLMRREQVLKVCCNHFITSDIHFQKLTTSDRALTWSAQDYAEGEVRMEVFALKFKTPDLMLAFKDVVEDVQKDISSSAQSSPATAPKPSGKKDERPLSELFKPKSGSWECSGCFTRNDADVLSCPCCSQPKPGCENKLAENKPAAASQFTFGIKPTSATPAEENKSLPGFKFGDISTASKEKQPSLAEMFKPKEGSWVCQACYTRSDADKVMCPACETPKPGHENDVKAAQNNFSFGISSTPSTTFAFGTASNSTAVQKADSKAFSFGTSAPQGEPKSTFLFGVPSATSSDANKGFSFGSSSGQNSSATTTSGFVFGASVNSSQPSFESLASSQPNQESQPSFGSPHKFEFQMRPASPTKSPGKSGGAPSGEEDSEDEEDEEENTDVGDFKPVVPLPDKVPVLTGEEDETVLYCHRAKLFRFVAGNPGEWKERGLGEIKVLSHNVTNKPRLLMRREQVLKICLNHYISSDLEMMPKDEKTWMWGAQDFSDGVVATEKFACRFKTAEIAADFKAAIDKAKTLTVLPSPTPLAAESSVAANDDSRKDTPAMKGFSFVLPAIQKQNAARNLFGSNNETSSASDDVEIVYEAKVTPEEKSAALKLKLPENFYLYKQAPPCAGCPGCEKDSDSDQGENLSAVSIKAKADSSSTTTTFNASAAVFGSGSSLFSATSFTTPSSPLIFGGATSQASATPAFGSLFGTATGSTAVNSHSTAFPMLGSKPTGDTKEEKSISFLPVSNSPSFASLAATTQSTNVFKVQDPSKPFSFAGAGAKVFGKASSDSVSPMKSTNENDDDSGGENEVAGEVDTHDPHFEPIIAMPDMVEVRTGEEEEEKLFCQRSKLFRYDTKSKEWKERGVGEMKILKHPINGTFRLLLRREQVHKVVLNQRLDADMKLNPMKTSDKAWCWGGMNHAEDQAGALEELAVRFKNAEQAEEFRAKLEECQKLLVESGVGLQTAGVIKEANEDREDEEEEDDGEEDEDDDDDEYEDDEDGDYEGDFEILFEEPATLVAEGEGPDKSTVEGKGNIRIIISASTGVYYVEMEDDSGRVLCKAPIVGDAEVQRDANVCTWRSLDLAENEENGIEKKFISTFESENEADAFQELYAKITIEIVEQTYDYVDRQED